MKITESQLRKIVRQEARRLSEMGPPRVAPQSYAPGTSPHFSYRTKVARLEQALDILEELGSAEVAQVGESDPDLENLIRALAGYLESVQVMADQESRVG